MEQEGFKIFVYHSTIKDFMPWSQRMIPGIYGYNQYVKKQEKEEIRKFELEQAREK
jgi:hypothetical protein